MKAEDLNLAPKQEEMATEIIIAGHVLYENLKRRNITAKWLIDNLKMMNIKDIREINYASIDEKLQIYIDPYEDHFHKEDTITEEQSSDKN